MGTNKVATVVLLDVNSSMKNPTHNGVSYFDRSLKCLKRMVLRKMFSQDNDEIGIILFGSDTTDNSLADESSRYRDISTFSSISLPSWKLYREIEKIEPSHKSKSDWLEAVVVAVNFLKVETEGRRFRTKQLIVFSNCEGNIEATDECVSTIISLLNELNVLFIVVGNDMEEECSQGSEISKSLRLIYDVVTRIDSGVHFSFPEIEKDLEYFEKKRKMGRLLKVNLVIGSKIHLPVRCMKVTNEETRFKWDYPPEQLHSLYAKKSAEQLPSLYAEKSAEQLPSLYDKKSAEESTSADTSRSTVSFVTDVVKKTNFGGSLVELSYADLEAMKRKTNPCLYYLGCVKSSKISRSMFVSKDVYVVVADKDARSVSMFSAFVDALIKANKYGIARRVAMRNGKIVIGALLPVSDELGKALYFTQLPYSEWVRKVPEIRRTVEMDEEALKVMSDFIDSSMLPADLAEEGKGLLLRDPTFQATCDVLTQRALGKLPEFSFPSLSENVKKIIEPIEENKDAKKVLTQLSNIFPYVPPQEKFHPKKDSGPNPSSLPQPDVKVKVEGERGIDDILSSVKQSSQEMF